MKNKKKKKAERDAELLRQALPESSVKKHLTITDPDVDPEEVMPDRPELELV